MRYYIGVDWADAEHAVWVEAEHATLVTKRTVAQTAAGLSEWGRWLDERRAEGIDLWAAIEKPEGRIVDFLLDHGVLVFAVNPKAVDRARDRFRMSSAKSDPFDARVLATFLRTDHTHLAPLRPSSEAAQELNGLTRDYVRHVPHQTRRLNQLTVTLKAYSPRGLELGGELTSQWRRAFLHDFSTPAALATLTERQWHRWGRAHRLSAARMAELWPVLQAPQIPGPPHVVRVHARRLGTLLPLLAAASSAVEAYPTAVTDFFGSMPTAEWATSRPGASGTTVPRLYAELGDADGRWQTFRHWPAPGGTVPVTERSGHSCLVKFRFAGHLHLRDAVQQFAFQSLQHRTWARAYYDRCRQRDLSHHHALRSLAAKWLKIIFVLSTRHIASDETYHLATIGRQHLQQPA